MKRLVLALLLCSPALAQVVPAPQIPVTGTLGAGGIFPFQNSGQLVFASDANHTMVYPEMTAYFLKVTSGVSLTATRNLVAPSQLGFTFVVENATTGGQAIQVIGSTGTGITIPNGATSQVYSDGTNYLQATANGGCIPTGSTGSILYINGSGCSPSSATTDAGGDITTAGAVSLTGAATSSVAPFASTCAPFINLGVAGFPCFNYNMPGSVSPHYPVNGVVNFANITSAFSFGPNAPIPRFQEFEVDGNEFYSLNAHGDVGAQSLATTNSIGHATEVLMYGADSPGHVPGEPSRNVLVPSGVVATNICQTSGTHCPSFFANPMTTLGDVIYGGTSGTATRLAGVTTSGTPHQFLNSVGTGSASTAPSWTSVTFADINGGTSPTGVTYTVASSSTIQAAIGGTIIATSVPFTSVTSGPNANALTIATGGSLGRTGTGTIDASTLLGNTIGTSGGTIPLLNTANTWSAAQSNTTATHAEDWTGAPATGSPTDAVLRQGAAADCTFNTAGTYFAICLPSSFTGRGIEIFRANTSIMRVTPTGGLTATNLTASNLASASLNVAEVSAAGQLLGSGLPVAGSGAGFTTGPISGTVANHGACFVGTNGQIQDCGIVSNVHPHNNTANIQPVLFTTSTMLGPVWYEPVSGSAFVFARLSGTISCTVAPSVQVMDLGTSPSTAYGSATAFSTFTTGTSDGVFPASLGVYGNTTAGHFYGVAFNAGTCVTAPTIDVDMTVQ